MNHTRETLKNNMYWNEIARNTSIHDYPEQIEDLRLKRLETLEYSVTNKIRDKNFPGAIWAGLVKGSIITIPFMPSFFLLSLDQLLPAALYPIGFFTLFYSTYGGPSESSNEKLENIENDALNNIRIRTEGLGELIT